MGQQEGEARSLSLLRRCSREAVQEPAVARRVRAAAEPLPEELQHQLVGEEHASSHDMRCLLNGGEVKNE